MSIIILIIVACVLLYIMQYMVYPVLKNIVSCIKQDMKPTTVQPCVVSDMDDKWHEFATTMAASMTEASHHYADTLPNKYEIVFKTKSGIII